MMEKDLEKAQRLNEVYKYVFAHFDIKSKKHFADLLHIQRTGLSAAMNGSKANLTKNLFTKICAAFPGVFNFEYLWNGKGSLLTIEEEVKSEEIEKMANPAPPQAIDYAFLIEKAVEKATAYADKMIANLEKQVADKNQEIATLKTRINELEAIIRNQSSDDILKNHPFPIGVADDGSLHITVDK